VYCATHRFVANRPRTGCRGVLTAKLIQQYAALVAGAAITGTARRVVNRSNSLATNPNGLCNGLCTGRAYKPGRHGLAWCYGGSRSEMSVSICRAQMSSMRIVMDLVRPSSRFGLIVALHQKVAKPFCCARSLYSRSGYIILLLIVTPEWPPISGLHLLQFFHSLRHLLVNLKSKAKKTASAPASEPGRVFASSMITAYKGYVIAVS